MWTFDNFPIDAANQTLGNAVRPGLAGSGPARLGALGSASGGLVSAEGLILANEHVVATCVENLSTPQQRFAETGFTPASRAEERACPGMTAEILVGISDVTERMQRAAMAYDPAVNRSILVTAAAVTAALRHAYGMDHLLNELACGPKTAAFD
jgi:hypothetical protein